jgi:aminoglycoside 2''-phosphotransferase
MLRALHDFPVDRAAELLKTGPPRNAGQRHFEDLWPIVERDALPYLDRALAERVRTEYERFLQIAFDLPYCLVHNDLGPEHILLSEATSLPVGMLDFEDSWVGDPAVDLVPFVAMFGVDTLGALTGRRDLGEDVRDRMWFYRCMGSVHAVIYGTQTDNQHERQDGIQELGRRISQAR